MMAKARMARVLSRVYRRSHSSSSQGKNQNQGGHAANKLNISNGNVANDNILTDTPQTGQQTNNQGDDIGHQGRINRDRQPFADKGRNAPTCATPQRTEDKNKSLVVVGVNDECKPHQNQEEDDDDQPPGNIAPGYG